MNYIVLNGARSTSVKGLLIQSLPPITKPQIRTSVEEIDGRDGDIVTKLGYAAYDKELSIGLYGDYDIDDVIKYFDSSGEVVFSNEPDKYYRYEIVEQIDFERLIRFRTAKVKMHVQPFKYSAVDRYLKAFNQWLNFNSWNSSKYGVILKAENGTISIKGTAQSTIEFYMPIEPTTLKPDNYKFSASVVGTAEGCAVRMIADRPTNAYSFGQNYISLKNNATAELTSQDAGNLKYNYLWFYIPSGTNMNCTVKTSVSGDSFRSVEIVNRGNVVSKPKITIYGSGTVTLSINGVSVLSANIDDEYITIDPAEMNAYHDGTLKNRQVTGDYTNLIFKVGNNVLSWEGNVTGIEIENFARWI